jgi:hypothetical protein
MAERFPIDFEAVAAGWVADDECVRRCARAYGYDEADAGALPFVRMRMVSALDGYFRENMKPLKACTKSDRVCVLGGIEADDHYTKTERTIFRRTKLLAVDLAKQDVSKLPADKARAADSRAARVARVLAFQRHEMRLGGGDGKALPG